MGIDRANIEEAVEALRRKSVPGSLVGCNLRGGLYGMVWTLCCVCCYPAASRSPSGRGLAAQ